MPKRDVLVLQTSDSPWNEFLKEYFQETASRLSFLTEASTARSVFEKTRPFLTFADPALLTLSLSQCFEVARQKGDSFMALATGALPQPCRFHFDQVFAEIPSMPDFHKSLMRELRFPEKVRVLVVDDEPEIGKMICDFFDRRVNPSFDTQHARDGQEGFDQILRDPPDVLILDIKMPRMDGREVYREMRKRGIEVPTIVFFDSVFGNELAEMRRYGRPAVIEKGSPQSALPELMELARKMWFFS